MFQLHSFFQSPQIPDECNIVWVSDLYVEHYVGGAELTSQALINSSPFPIFKVLSKDVTSSLIEQGKDKYWIFGNFSQLSAHLYLEIQNKLEYSILEYDYKYCAHRSPEKHQEKTGTPCNCSNTLQGQAILGFFQGADTVFWMSQAQLQKYKSVFPTLHHQPANIVLSSVFDNETLDKIRVLRDGRPRQGWVVLGSNSWVKGAAAAEDWCTEHDKSYQIIWNMPYEQVLKQLSRAEGFVYLPKGSDTCPRMVIEAKLLGCELELNEHVQHTPETWWQGPIEEIDAYLRGRPRKFWDTITSNMGRTIKLSGYTTTYNCVSQKYPFIQSIKSMLQFCDEVIVVDGGSDDDTWEQLVALQTELVPITHRIRLYSCYEDRLASQNVSTKLKLHSVPRDWSHPRSAVFDGLQKAEALKRCIGDWCWQMDSDEIVHEDDIAKIRQLIHEIPKTVNILALPVTEYWGGPDKVRMDINPEKWRLIRNGQGITHGIPASLRALDENGDTYSLPGSDGCDLIDSQTFQPVPHMGFVNDSVRQAKWAAEMGNIEALQAYSEWWANIVRQLPGVHHFSWWDMERKIRTYRDFWSRHWNSLHNKSTADTPENNMSFDSAWSDVTDEQISELAVRLKTEMGGWIFHRKIDWSRPTLALRPVITLPTLAKEFYRL